MNDTNLAAKKKLLELMKQKGREMNLISCHAPELTGL